MGTVVQNIETQGYTIELGYDDGKDCKKIFASSSKPVRLYIFGQSASKDIPGMEGAQVFIGSAGFRSKPYIVDKSKFVEQRMTAVKECLNIIMEK